MGEKSSDKKVFIVTGAPGSGKTAVAANILLEAIDLQNRYGKNGNIQFFTSSTNQTTWANTFFGFSGIFGNTKDFNPGINSNNESSLAKIFQEKYADCLFYDSKEKLCFDPVKWRTTWSVLREEKIDGLKANISENMYDFAIVDEAHSLIKRVEESSDGTKLINYGRPGNWFGGIGPQAYYAIYASRIVVFFMEDAQGFGDREKTTISDIQKWASELGVTCQEFKLEKQFRCGESNEYIDWANDLLYRSGRNNHKDWEKKFYTSIVDYPAEMEEYLEKKRQDGCSVRLISSYSVPWPTREMSYEAKAKLELNKMDFYFEDGDGKGNPWGKCWNSPGQFVVPTTNINMLNNPLFEVGYPQEIRGWDFDYFGILWLDDLVWRKEDGWGIRANMMEENAPFRGKENGPWFGPIQDDAIASCRKLADKELINRKKEMQNEIKSLEKSLKSLNSDLIKIKKKSSKCYNIDLQIELEKKINIASADIQLMEDELRAKRAEWKDFLTEDKIIFKHPDFPAVNDLIDAQFRIYRILLTRALKGNVIYVKDPETREHLRELLK